MNVTRAKQVLLRVFDRLGVKEREQLKWHAHAGTPVACGKFADYYATATGHA